MNRVELVAGQGDAVVRVTSDEEDLKDVVHCAHNEFSWMTDDMVVVDQSPATGFTFGVAEMGSADCHLCGTRTRNKCDNCSLHISRDCRKSFERGVVRRKCPHCGDDSL